MAMRLQDEEVSLLKNKLKELSGTAKLYLFGSRVDDNKQGGDIDLLIVTKELTNKDVRKLRIEFFKVFGEQKLDIVVDDGSFTNPFHKLIFKKSILL